VPFRSEQQRKWMYANEPEMAARWQKETPKGEKLPKKVKKKAMEKQAINDILMSLLAGGGLGGLGGAAVAHKYHKRKMPQYEEKGSIRGYEEGFADAGRTLQDQLQESMAPILANITRRREGQEQKVASLALLLAGGVKHADFTDPEMLLAALGIGVGGAAAGGAARGLIGSAGPERRDIAEGLQGKDRGKVRRAYEHLVNPQGAAAFLQGKALREAIPGKAEGLAEDMHGEYGPGSKAIRFLQHATSPLTVGLAPVTALGSALRRYGHSKGVDRGFAHGGESMSPVARAGAGAGTNLASMLASIVGLPGGVVSEGVMSGIQGGALRGQVHEHMGRGLTDKEFARYETTRKRQ